MYILLMITLNPPSELLKEKPWDEGKEVVLGRRDFVPFELFTLREVIDGVWRFVHKLDVKWLCSHLYLNCVENNLPWSFFRNVTRHLISPSVAK